MKVIQFEFDSYRTVNVVAPTVQDAIRHLCESDYFCDVDDGDGVEWITLPDDTAITIGFDDDPDADDLAMPGSEWNEGKRSMTAPAKSWAGLYDTVSIISDSES